MHHRLTAPRDCTTTNAAVPPLDSVAMFERELHLAQQLRSFGGGCYLPAREVPIITTELEDLERWAKEGGPDLIELAHVALEFGTMFIRSPEQISENFSRPRLQDYPLLDRADAIGISQSASKLVTELGNAFIRRDGDLDACKFERETLEMLRSSKPFEVSRYPSIVSQLVRAALLERFSDRKAVFMEWAFGLAFHYLNWVDEKRRDHAELRGAREELLTVLSRKPTSLSFQPLAEETSTG